MTSLICIEIEATAQFTETNYNIIHVIENDNRYFNVKKLIMKYQPKNRSISWYLRDKLFALLFDEKSIQYTNEQPGQASILLTTTSRSYYRTTTKELWVHTVDSIFLMGSYTSC
jgi:hypothetical protein